VGAPSLVLPASEHDILREVAARCKARFAYFARKAWDTLEPGNPLVPGYHWDAICEHLQAVAAGQIRKLLINIAPGHGKSTLVSVLFPAWLWTIMPEARWLCASYSDDLAIRDNRNCRSLIESEWYQALFGDVFQMARDQNMKSYFENTKRGYRQCTAVRASGTGKRGSHLLIDDPNNAMATRADVLATIEWYGRTWASRLNDKKRGAMIVVGQRLYENDLSGHLLELGGWEHLNLPTEYEPERKCFTSIGWTDPRTIPGELLWPQRYTREDIAEWKKELGSINYAAQHQQSPVPAGGAIFKKEWFREFEEDENYFSLKTLAAGPKRVPKNACQIVVTSDLAVSLKQEADFTVFAVWAITPDKELLLLEIWRDHWDNPDQKKQIRLLYQIWKPVYIAIESVAYQLAIIQDLRRSNDDPRLPREEGSLPIKEYKIPQGRDKVARASSAAVYYESERIFHRKGAEWLAEFLKELLLFPKGEHDDQCDVVSMICDLVSSVPTSKDHIEFAKQLQQARRRARHAEMIAFGPPPETVGGNQTNEEKLFEKIKEQSESAHAFYANRRPTRPPAPAQKAPLDMISTDFVVEVQNAELLDRTLRALPQAHAFVLGGGEHIVRTPDGYVIVRVHGDPGFFKFAVERQGYCRIVQQLDQLYGAENI
jgi:predicted phage terminase large subunit-like protein